MRTQDRKRLVKEVDRIRSGRLHPVEEARIIARFAEATQIKSQSLLALCLGLSQSLVSQRLALFQMPSDVLDLMLCNRGLTTRHAREIRKLPDRTLQVTLAHRVHQAGLTVSETADIVADMLHTFGVVTRPTSWSRFRSLRWRVRLDVLEIKVHGATHHHRVEVLKLFLRRLQKPEEPSSLSPPHSVSR